MTLTYTPPPVTFPTHQVKVRVHIAKHTWQSWIEIDGTGFPLATKLGILPDQHGNNELWLAIPLHLTNVELV